MSKDLSNSQITLLSSSENPETLFQIIETIGAGSYGEVYKARYVKTNAVCAIKSIPIDCTENDELIGVLNEVKLLKSCDHPNIVTYFGCYLKSSPATSARHKRKTSSLWIVMEYCECGSLESIIKRSQSPSLTFNNFSSADRSDLSELEIAAVLYQVLNGLSWLHRNGQMHRDIKAANILLTGEGVAKMADFGVSAQLTQTLMRKKTVIGTPYWMAPEVILAESSGDTYGLAADIWSVGITAIELATRRPPLYDLHPMKALFLIPKSEPPTLRGNEWSLEFRDFVRACLCKNSDQRPSAETAMRHPFFYQITSGKAAVQEIVNGILHKRLLGSSKVESISNNTDVISVRNNQNNIMKNTHVHNQPSPRVESPFVHNQDSNAPDYSNDKISSKSSLPNCSTSEFSHFSHERIEDLSTFIQIPFNPNPKPSLTFNEKFICGFECDNYVFLGNEQGLFCCEKGTLSIRNVFPYGISQCEVIDDNFALCLTNSKEGNGILYSFNPTEIASLPLAALKKFCKVSGFKRGIESIFISSLVCPTQILVSYSKKVYIYAIVKGVFSKLTSFKSNQTVIDSYFHSANLVYILTDTQLIAFSYMLQCKKDQLETLQFYNSSISTYKDPLLITIHLYLSQTVSSASPLNKPVSIHQLQPNCYFISFQHDALYINVEKREISKFYWSKTLVQSKHVNSDKLMLIFNNGSHISSLASLFQGESVACKPASEEIYYVQSKSNKEVLCYEWDSSLGKGTLRGHSLLSR